MIGGEWSPREWSMPDGGVSVARDALRGYADHLERQADRVERSRYKVDAGLIPVGAWGIPGGVSTGYRFDPDEPGRVVHFASVGTPDEALVYFRGAYEAAHHAAVRRLVNLQLLYLRTRDALHLIATNYARADGVDETDPRLIGGPNEQ